MVPTDPSKPYLGIIGDSATHWFHGDCLGETYPALIAKHFPNYNVIDLSIIGSGNVIGKLIISAFKTAKTRFPTFITAPKYELQFEHVRKSAVLVLNW